MKRILLVCTGNTCRSPMAEGILKELAKKRGRPLEVRSAGVSTVDGLPVSVHAAGVLRKREASCPSSSKALDGGSVVWADLILTMTTSHKRSLLQRFPHAVDKTYTLKEFVGSDEKVLADIAELEALYTEWQMKQVLGQQMTSGERDRLLELEKRIPNFDIADPFGGSMEIYERSADEIEAALQKLLDKLGPAH
ncbi:low molecular weight protein arginine phosphatase [Paenibacillus nasutitermitis]|uniref:Protein-tyrosine-phosphatase n=1 Tax=Paenibacillus nasutitermitis TaxID=1652958 RepID=A0A917E252_9BACL|nr:low molecular weight protein arginine phosphatase [Paenibacillus nasutitermitis]GGD92810.1 protein-tyrosine-phosphatase [Paenibacillus nasutitermitis]